MKKITILIIALIIGNISFSQNIEKSIKEIRKHYQWVNSQKDFKIEKLETEDLLLPSYDGGFEQKAYFKNDKLYKIVQTVGVSTCIYVTEFYFWEDKLFFVYDIQKDYAQKTDANGIFLEFDYTKTEISYQGRFYYKDRKEIRKILKGKKSYKADFLKDADELKKRFKNKYKYRKLYKQIESKWVSDKDSHDILEFKGLVKTETYDKESDSYSYKIEGKYLYCYDSNNKQVAYYEIIEISNTKLKLMYLPRGLILNYTKKK